MPKVQSIKKDKKVVDLMDVIESTATVKKTGKTKKKNSEIINDAPKNVKRAIDKYVAAKKDKKIAESEMAVHSNVIIDFAGDVHDELAFKGQFKKSHKIKGNDEQVTYVTADTWSLDPDDVSEINKILGNDDLIEKTITVKLKPEVLKSPEMRQELMKMMGDRFQEFFQSEVSYKTVKGFDEAVYNTLDDEDDLEELRSLIKQKKASIR